MSSFAEQVKSSLLKIISDMAAHPEDFSKNPETDFSRNRKLDFSTLLHLIISMETGTVRDELLKFFSYDTYTATNSAFFQQRAKLRDNALPHLFYTFNSLYPCTLYKGRYQLLASDGSSFTFTRNPLDQDSYFAPDGKTTNGYNQVHVIPVFDLLSKRYTDCVVQPIRKKNEFKALCELIDRHQSPSGIKPIFIADRGFHALNVFAHAIEHDSYFLVRATDIKMQRLLAADLPLEDCFDIQVNRILTRTISKKKRLHPELSDQYKFICKDVTFDYIDAEKQTEYPIALRILRFQISETGYENIITNLPSEEFPLDEIKRLYHLRWGIETSFRELKYVIGALNFHSKKREYIEMEVWARLLLYNFCSIITGNVVINRKGRKHPLQVNYAVAYKACHYFLRLHNGEAPPDIESLIEKNSLPIRLNRNYARQHRFRVPVSFMYRFA
jgi:hypothetical protein